MALMRRTPEPRRRQRHCGVVLMAADAVGAHKEQEMAKLSDTQLIVLSTAAARNDGAATIPDGLNKAAASKLRASLVSRKLMREVGSNADMPVWHEDEEGRRTSLIITRDGRGAIGVAEETDEGAQDSTTPKNDSGGGARRQTNAQQKRGESIDQPRPGSKQ